jgi:hypothetical protein
MPLNTPSLRILLAAGWAWHARARATSRTAKTSVESRAPEYSHPR